MWAKFQSLVWRRSVKSSPRGLAATVLLAIVASLALADAKAADASNGERIAKTSCAACHIVEASMIRREVADAPPFIVIARKFNSSPDLLVLELLEIHPKMNFALTRREANDVAAYISTLGQ